MRDNGREAAEDILKILHDDLFDLKEFRKQVTSLEQCSTIADQLTYDK